MFAKELHGLSSISPEHSGRSRHPNLNLLVRKGMQRLLQGWGVPLWSPGKLVPWHCYSGLLLSLLYHPHLLCQVSLKLCPSSWRFLIPAAVKGLFLYTYELFRSGPKLQRVGVVGQGQGALERRQLAVCRAVRKFLPGLAALTSGTFLFITPALLIYH